MSTAPQQFVVGGDADDELRLPRPPGVIRSFWARHPLLSDVLIAVFGLLLSIPAGLFGLDGGQAALLPPGAILVLVLVACALLVWRRRWPVVAFGASLAVAFGDMLSAEQMGSPLLLVTTYSVAVYRSNRACWIAYGAGVAVLLALGLALAATGTVPFGTSAVDVIASAVMALIGALVGVNVGNRKRYLAAVIDRSRQLLVERDQQARLAADAERRRIAREMHDIVSHSLTVIVALTEGAAATDDRDRARAVNVQAAATARAALREMRSMLGVLRDENGDAPLAPLEEDAVPTAIERARQAGFPVSLTVSGRPEVPRAVGFALARIVQEGLTNAMRHAPRATAIDVAISYLPDAVAVEVRNDGAAASPNVGGYGLRGLRERVAHVGGTIDSAPAAPGRWRLRAWLPYEPVAPNGTPQSNDPPEAP